MKKRLVTLVLATVLGLISAACGEEDKAGEYEACVEDGDCQVVFNCEDGICIEVISRDIYEPCLRDGECRGGTCATGYCTTTCSQFYPTGTYVTGDCVADADMSMCVRDGIGCCYITSVEGASNPNQEQVSGFCTSTP